MAYQILYFPKVITCEPTLSTFWNRKFDHNVRNNIYNNIYNISSILGIIMNLDQLFIAPQSSFLILIFPAAMKTPLIAIP